MRMLLLRFLLPVGSLALLWVFAGSRIALVLDGFFLDASGELEAVPLSLTTQRFCLGEHCYWMPGTLQFGPGGGNQLQLSWLGKTIALGPIEQCSGTYYQFRPAAGDQVRFTQSYSRMPWPTPFEYSLFSLPTTSWRRHSYRRLEWKKSNGDLLEIVWRDGQSYYKQSGWSFDNRQYPPSIQITKH